MIISLEKATEVARNYVQGTVKAVVVGDHEVGVVLEGGNHGFIYRHDVMLVAVQDIIQVIAAFDAIPFDAATKFYMILGLNKNLQVQLGGDLFKILYKQTLDDDDRRRLEDKLPGFLRGVIECVFHFGHHLPALKHQQVVMKSFAVDRGRKVKILYLIYVLRLLIAGLVIVVLGDETQLLGSKPGLYTLEERRFS